MNAADAWINWWDSLSPDEKKQRRAQMHQLHETFRAERKAVLWGVLEPDKDPPLLSSGCPVRKCKGKLIVEQTHKQDGTGELAVTTRCNQNRSHRFFIVLSVGRPVRLTDDTRWEKK